MIFKNNLRMEDAAPEKEEKKEDAGYAKQLEKILPNTEGEVIGFKIEKSNKYGVDLNLKLTKTKVFVLEGDSTAEDMNDFLDSFAEKFD